MSRLQQHDRPAGQTVDAGAYQPPRTDVQPGSEASAGSASCHESAGQDESDELAAVREEIANLRAAMATRGVIEQAKGVLMWRYQIPAETAFALLRRWSQDSNIKLHTIAHAVTQVACHDGIVYPGEHGSGADSGLVRLLQQQLDRDSHDTAAAEHPVHRENQRATTAAALSQPDTNSANTNGAANGQVSEEAAAVTTTTFHLRIDESKGWCLIRDGSRVGVYDTETAAIRAAFDQAATGPKTRVVVYDSAGHVHAAPKQPLGILEPPQTAALPRKDYRAAC